MKKYYLLLVFTMGLFLFGTAQNDDCGECEGQITYLNLQYTGDETGTVKVYEGKVKEDKLFHEEENVSNGSEFSFVGPKNHNKMGAKIFLTINDGEAVEIHTSCSQDIYAGQTWGDYYIVAGESHEGGPLCYYEDEEEEEDCGECEGQITYLNLKFTGDETGTVKVYEGKVKEDKLFHEEENVSNGSEFSFVGPKNHNKMGSKIFLTINDGNAVEIHTSCSQDIYAGMEFGNRYLILDGTSHEGGALCALPPECEIEDLCDVLPETADIELLSQGPDSYINIEVTNGDWLNGVYLGWCVDTDNGIELDLYNADVYCSYGEIPDGLFEYPENFDLINWILNNVAVGQTSSCTGDDAGEYTYGDIQRAIWALIDDGQSTDGLGTWSQCRADEIEANALANGEGFEPVPGELFAVIFDPGVDLQKVIISIPFTCPEEPEECNECEGQITSLDLEYQGTETNATITVYKGKVETGKELAIFTNVNNGDILSFVGDPTKQNKMGAKIRITVDGVDGYTEIHTSCSQDIYAGQTWGDYYIVAGESHEGGPLCSVEEDNEECGECEGQITSLDLEYTGDEVDAFIRIYEGKVKADKLFKTFENVNKGDVLSFVGSKGDNKMGAKIFLTVNGVDDNDDSDKTEIHTSCSQDIYVGQYWGEYLILAGESHEGGPLCEYDPDKAAGINDNSQDLVVYPNPMSNSGTLMFSAAEDANATVEVYNLVGLRVDILFNDYVEAGSQTSISIDANKYPKGMYIIYIRNGSSTMKEKLSIMK